MQRKVLDKAVKNWNPALFGIRIPAQWNPESSTRNPESTAWNPESKTAMDSLTWGEKLVLPLECRFIDKSNACLTIVFILLKKIHNVAKAFFSNTNY